MGDTRIILETYIQGWKKRDHKLKTLKSNRLNQARKILPDIIDILKKYHVKKIILFGSLVDINHFRLHSDIDIAVEGLDPKRFFEAYGEIMSAIDFPVDLKPIEKLEPFFKQRIMTYGEIIYDTKRTAHRAGFGDSE